MDRLPEPLWRPTREQVLSSSGRTIPDVLQPGLDLVFCGINPGLYSAATGHHFARPGNRFWPALHGAGFTDRLLSPFEDVLLPRYGLGVTNLVPRATAGADELAPDEFVEGGRLLLEKLRRVRPRAVGIVGIGAYRIAFDRRRAVVGLQDEDLGGLPVWVLPNTSGRGAHYQIPVLVELFVELHRFVEERIRDSSEAGSGKPSRTSSRSSSSGRTRRTRRTSRSPR